MARSWRWLSAARRLIVRSSCTSANDLGPIKNNTAKIRNPMVVGEGSIHAAAVAGHHDRSCDSKKDDGGGGGGGDSGKKKIVVRREATAREQSAAIIIQACFRAHLARRAFRALKSLVRLQAVVRGACVRRQARVAVQCMQALVRLQVRVRARHLLAVGRSGGHQ